MQTKKLNQESKKYGKWAKEFQSYLIENLDTNFTILSIDELLQSFLELKKMNDEKSSLDDGFEKYLKKIFKYEFNRNETEIEIFDWYKKVLNISEDVTTKIDLKHLGSETKRLRLAQKWSTRKLAELSGMSLGFINQLENGKLSDIKISNMVKLAEVFNTDLLELFFAVCSTHFKPTVKPDWRVNMRSNLSKMEIDGDYINEIISYIETVQIKQERQKPLEY